MSDKPEFAAESVDKNACESRDGIEEASRDGLEVRQNSASAFEKYQRANTGELVSRGVLPAKPLIYDSSAAAHQLEEPLMAPGDVPVESKALPEQTVEEKPVSPDVVIAYDDNGQAHEFKNEPIRQMPPDFASVPDWRQKQLDQQAEDLLEKYSAQGRDTEDKSMDFQKVADMQKEIAQRPDLTETEKCLLYSKIQVTMQEQKVTVENWNEKPEMIDSWSGQRDPWHAIAPIDDRYHNRLVNMTPEEASRAIQVQEDSTEGDMHDSIIDRAMWKTARAILGINQGDINASEGQLKCMRELREKGTFAAYANEWERQYVNKGGVNPRDVDPQGGAEGAGPVGTDGAGGSRG